MFKTANMPLFRSGGVIYGCCGCTTVEINLRCNSPCGFNSMGQCTCLNSSNCVGFPTGCINATSISSLKHFTSEFWFAGSSFMDTGAGCESYYNDGGDGLGGGNIPLEDLGTIPPNNTQSILICASGTGNCNTSGTPPQCTGTGCGATLVGTFYFCICGTVPPP